MKCVHGCVDDVVTVDHQLRPDTIRITLAEEEGEHVDTVFWARKYAGVCIVPATFICDDLVVGLNVGIILCSECVRLKYFS